MLTPNDIGDALEELVCKTFPGEKVYREFCPENFERPSFFLELEGCGTEVNFGTGIVTLRPAFAVTAFTEVDDYYHSHLKGLGERQMALLGLFLPGYVKAGDRAPHVEQLAAENGYDFATVRARFMYTLGRDEFIKLRDDIKERQLMLTLHLREENDTNV